LAQIGAFIAFVPLLQMIVPQQTTLIAPGSSAILLGHLTIVGALVASAANLAAGALSDATPVRWGRRRAWMVAGLAGVLLSYALVATSRGAAGLMLAVVCFQIAFNTLFAPLTALLAEQVPQWQRGTVAALLGLGLPIGTVVGTSVAGLVRAGIGMRLAAVGALVVACILPLTLTLRETVAEQQPLSLGSTRGFAVSILGRLCVVGALNLVQIYLLLFLVGAPLHGLALPFTPDAAMARLVAIATVGSVTMGLLTGRLSDRLGRRRRFIIGGATLAGLGTLAIPWAGGWTWLEVAVFCWGCGSGMFQAADLALMARLLPSSHRAGRGFGIANLANTLPQVAMPLLAIQMLGGQAPDYRPLFAVAAVVAVLGGALVLGVKVR
jgi:MFS family permease